jgi:glycosyltransferase involved in cell wall biosynthesis
MIGSDLQLEVISKFPLVSVVTPFYNTEAYLEECITSVIRQTYTNWEYVLVNNCSTDQSAAIAEHYAKQYPERIRLIHNNAFLSQVENYNAALRAISSESKYCKLVQADDWLFPDCIRSMVQVAEEHPRVGIVSAYGLEGDEVRLDGLPYPSPEVSGRDICRLYFLQGKYLFGTPTSILLRSEIVCSRESFYDERYAPFEDGHACFDLLRFWNFGFVHQVLTYSRRDNDGIISKASAYGLEPFLNFSMLMAHGRNYLSEREYRQCFKKVERTYLVFLSKHACARHRQGRDFWQFHRRGLASVGYTLDWHRLAMRLPRALVDKAWALSWKTWDRLTS